MRKTSILITSSALTALFAMGLTCGQALESITLSPSSDTAIVEGDSILLSATVDPEDACSKVTFFVNGSEYKSITEPPFECYWPESQTAAGDYEVYAVAYNGDSLVSAKITIAYGEGGLSVYEYMIDASDMTPDSWTYFDFSAGDSGQVVSVSAPETSLDWDIRLHRYQIGTNSGTSGSGQGGAYYTGETDFASVTTIKAEGYTADEMIEESMSPGDSTSWNNVFYDWYDMDGMPPTLTSKGYVYGVKTADAKYAKIQTLDYYNADGTSGFLTVKYVYQPDGSTGF